jgi:hypothetical protein
MLFVQNKYPFTHRCNLKRERERERERVRERERETLFIPDTSNTCLYRTLKNTNFLFCTYIIKTDDILQVKKKEGERKKKQAGS